MLKILQEISKKAILLNKMPLTEEQRTSQWIGFLPASEAEIAAAETRLGVKLPKDYIEFLKISNGFSQYIESTSCSFLPVGQIDFLKVLNEEVIEVWDEHGLTEVAASLACSILVGGLNESQHFLLVPPNATSEEWQYWKFASWIPGEEPYPSLQAYFVAELAFLEELTNGL